jgi:hypothetical protein
MSGMRAVLEGFRSKHSWYKHLVGPVEFFVAPAVDRLADGYHWEIVRSIDRLTRLPEKVRGIVRRYPIWITPFVYPMDSQFRHAAGNWGWPMFDWLDANGLEQPSRVLRPLCRDNSAARDCRYKILFDSTWDDESGERQAVAAIVRHEFERTVNDSSEAARKIRRDLVAVLASRFALLLTTLPTDVIALIADYSLDLIV